MNKGKETRAAGAKVDLREAEGEGVLVEGYAAIFNEWADIGGYYQERIAIGAFDGVLGDDVRFLINHEGLPLARVSSGTLALSVDSHGLKMQTRLDPTDPDAARVIAKMRRGDVREMSFAFYVESDQWDDASGPIPRRTILKIKELVDVAVVTVPAYAGTEIGLRSLQEHRAAQDGGAQDFASRKRRLRMRVRLA